MKVLAVIFAMCIAAALSADGESKDKRGIYSTGYGAYPAAAGIGYSGLGAYSGYNAYGAYPYAAGAIPAAAAYPAASYGGLGYPAYSGAIHGYSG